MVISSMPIGEYDRRLEILTDSIGRISAFARGARKPSSPLVSISRVFAFGEFELYEGRNSYSVNSAKISNYFEELTKDVEKTYYGFYFLEVASYFTREGLDATETLKLIYQSLRALNVESLSHPLVRAIYEIKILEINGICPDTDLIKERYEPGQSALYAADFVKRTPVEKLFTFKLTPEVEQEFARMAQLLLGRFTDKQFRSLEMLESIS
ncbi:MAG: DNA repair protein RecO [Lachnospiraceae bacterium]|nr:DNA repair protein RecO [Lachnospiraceae bacterium]